MQSQKLCDILVVDDFDKLRRIIIRFTQSMIQNARCYEAKNGAEAIDLYRRICPAVVIMDVEMPIMDGITSMKSILKYDKDATILIMSGEDKFREIAFQAGAKEFIKKPFKIEERVEKLKKILELS